MKITHVLGLTAALFMVSTSTAYSAELHLTVGSQSFSDPSHGLVSDGPTTSMTGIRGAKAMAPDSNLSWVVGYETGSTQEYASNYSDAAGSTSAWTTLRMHALEFGVRAGRPIGKHVEPYAALGARAVGGVLTVTDDLTNWSMSDPADPTGQDTLYELGTDRDFGGSLGAQGTIGLALHFGPSSGSASAETSGPRLLASTDPKIGMDVAGEQVTEESEPARTRARRESRVAWGVYAEGGYALQSALRFTTSGQLGLGGPRFLAGAFVVF